MKYMTVTCLIISAALFSTFSLGDKSEPFKKETKKKENKLIRGIVAGWKVSLQV